MHMWLFGQCAVGHLKHAATMPVWMYTVGFEEGGMVSEKIKIVYKVHVESSCYPSISYHLFSFVPFLRWCLYKLHKQVAATAMLFCKLAFCSARLDYSFLQNLKSLISLIFAFWNMDENAFKLSKCSFLLRDQLNLIAGVEIILTAPFFNSVNNKGWSCIIFLKMTFLKQPPHCL